MKRSIGTGKIVVELRSEPTSISVCRKRSWIATGCLPIVAAACGELVGGLELALGRDDLRAPLALGLGLARHRPLHRLRDLDVLDLDRRDLDAPGLGLLVDDPLQLVVQAVALGQQRVELGAAEHRAQRRLRDLRGRQQVVLDLHDRVVRVHDAEVADGGHRGRHVVARDHLLRRDAERHRAQVDPHHPVDDRDQEDQARALLGDQAAEPEDHAALVLPQHPDRARQHDHGEEARTPRTTRSGGHVADCTPSAGPSGSRVAGATVSVSPSTLSTTTSSPDLEARRRSERARHSAPFTNTCPIGRERRAHLAVRADQLLRAGVDLRDGGPAPPC